MQDDYKYYMSRYINDSWEAEVSLEDYFEGLRYCKCEGLSTKGKPKNIYSESYPETDELRIFIPGTVCRENTDLEFEFVFKGENRRDVYDSFCEWITGYIIKYWDTCRNRKVEMYLSDTVEPDDDLLYGSEPYMSAKFKFKNIKGQTEKNI